jgi:hypothetical protein
MRIVTTVPATDRNSLDWRISTRSGGGNCVEVASDGNMIAFRHSKRPDAEVIWYSAAEFTAFVAGVKDGEFDDFCK